MAMKSFELFKKTDGQKIVPRCQLAETSWQRLVGLLNKKSLSSDEGLILSPCNQVHTFFMSFPIDAIFLSSDNKILGIHKLHPWRVSKIYFKAKKVLELPLGTAEAKNLIIGDELELRL